MTLVVEDLGVDYGGGEVVHGFSVGIRPGEFVAMVGPNGAGKSSCLRAIMGLAPLSRGSVKYNGERIEAKATDVRARLGLVMVPEDRGLFPAMTVMDHLWLGAHKRPKREVLDEVFEIFPALTSRLGQKAGSLSGGEAQMLAIAAALLLRPEILMIDELSFGLAPIVVEDLLGRCRELVRAGTMGILVVEQFIELVLGVADRGVVLSHGEVRMSGPAQDIARRPEDLRAAYLG